MTSPKIGISDYDKMKARTMRIARGEEKPSVDDPKVWFPSTESLEQARSGGNPELLRTIEEQAPGALAADAIKSDGGK